jgi:hypothetical protein
VLPFAQRTLQGDVGLTVLSAPTLTVQRESPPFGTLRRGTAAARAAAVAAKAAAHQAGIADAAALAAANAAAPTDTTASE